MVMCGCISPCNCSISEDGYFGNAPSRGRANTQVTGNGSVSDPFVLSFIDSVNFRPQAAEVRYPNRTVADGTTTTISSPSSPFKGIVIYQTPGLVLLAFSLFNSIVLNAHYFIVGASVEWAATGPLGGRNLWIEADTSGPNVLPNRVIAGTSQSATNTVTVQTCSGYFPGIYTFNLDTSGFTSEFKIGVKQDGVAVGIPISNIKFWVTTI